MKTQRGAGASGRSGRSPARRRSTRRPVLVALAGLLALLLLFGGIAYARLVNDLPDLSQPPAPLAETSVIYDRNGEVLVELFAEQNRTYVPLESVPLMLRQAVIATEDQRFYEHEGVDPLGIARALWVDVTQGKRHGGSTITQQYVVNTLVKRENTLTRKVKEAILAYRLEEGYTKDEILEKYLNTIYFGHGAYGVQAGAQAYFGKDVGDLTTSESAVIAGVIRSPGTYSPRLDPEAGKNRRDTVLGQMLELDYLDQAQHDAAVAEPIALAAPEPTNAKAPYFVEWVKQTLVDMYGPDAVYKGGLRVKTTVDLTMQAAAESAIAAVLDRENDPSAALVATDPRTGEVLAMVGGKDFNAQQFNVAVQGHRQTGSSFKPFVLITGLEEGISPEKTYESGAASLTIPGGQTWKVTGAKGGGPVRLREATERSINSVFARLILEVGADKVARTAMRMGITTEIEPVPAIALGGLGAGVAPIEMASAFGTLANGGANVTPHGILEVKDMSGAVLYAAEPKPEQVLEPAVAYLTTNVLQGVVAGGTATAAKIGRPQAGKTGTTQQYRDAWFIGYTPNFVASVWVGHVDSQQEMLNVHGIKVTGGSFPAQIWAAFAKEALKNVEPLDFERPAGLVEESICLESGDKAGEYCQKKGTGLFLAAHTPQPCALHAGPTLVDVPNLVGVMKDAAIAQLGVLKLGYQVQERQIAGVPAGMVGDQDPRFGSQVEQGTVITLFVSGGTPSSEAPVAAFTFQPAAPRAGEAVTFDASNSSDDGEIVKYAWEFGDGSPILTGKSITHRYTSPATYTATLWVTDDAGKVSSLTLTVKVE